MNIIFSFLLILSAVFGLYKISQKHIQKTQQSQWSFLTIYPQATRFSCLILLFISTSLLMKQQGFSIGLMSFWIFSTPLLGLFIFSINPLRKPSK